MIIWVVALHCEAKPIIDFFRLKKSHTHHSFDVYQNDNNCCIISGIGKLNSTAATAWIAALHPQSRSIAWINLGIAGSASHHIGSVWWINKITDIESNRNRYPVPIIKSPIPSTHCCTYNRVDNEYSHESLSDMEASAFFDTATRFSSAELIHCIKIISDNKNTPSHPDKSQISQLIQHNMPQIVEFYQALEPLNQQLANIQITPVDWQKFLSQAHFSQTQTTQLKHCLRFLQSQNDNIDALITHTQTLNNSDSILAYLEQRRINLSRNL